MSALVRQGQKNRAYLGQSPTDSTGLLCAEVKGSVLLLLVQLAEVLPCLLVHDGHDPGNGLADSVAANSYQHPKYIIRGMTLQTHILVSFDAEPPAIFCTRSVRSSFFSSSSCFDRSFLDLGLRLACKYYAKTTVCALGLKLVRLDATRHFEGGRGGSEV